MSAACCLADLPDAFFIACDHCEKWYHGKCVNITEDQASFIQCWHCSGCCASDNTLASIIWKPKCIMCDRRPAETGSKFCSEQCGIQMGKLKFHSLLETDGLQQYINPERSDPFGERIKQLQALIKQLNIRKKELVNLVQQCVESSQGACGYEGCRQPKNCRLHSPPHTPSKSWLNDALPDFTQLLPNWAHLRAQLIDLELEDYEYHLRQLNALSKSTSSQQRRISVRSPGAVTIISAVDSHPTISTSFYFN